MRSSRKKHLPIVNWILLWAALTCLPVFGQTNHPLEYQVKAAFLFNFTQFVHWPESAFSLDSNLVIGILGEDPFGSILSSMVEGEQVNGRHIRVIHYTTASEVTACNILFISKQEQSRIPEILDLLKGRSILTVGESGDFAQMGGMIHLYNENNRIRLIVNNEVAKMANLNLSVKLLKLSTLVVTDNKAVK